MSKKRPLPNELTSHPVTDAADDQRILNGVVDRWSDFCQGGGSLPDLRLFVSEQASLPTSILLELILIDQKYQWQEAPGPRVEEYLDQFPQIRDQSEHQLDLVYGEIRARRKLGFPSKIEQYEARFPSLKVLLRKQLELVHWLDEGTPETAPEDSSTTRGEKCLGQYELLEPIHRSAMSMVFKARHRTLNRIVALKMLSPQRSTSEDVRRFKNEMLAVAQLDHPHILPIMEIGEDEGSLYYTSRLAEQGTLSDNLERFRNRPAVIAILIRNIALALHHAHQRGVLHRDIKPSNILIDRNDQPQVGDFGLARMMYQPSDLTQSGDMLGTPVWLAPEQAKRKPKPATVAGDVYGIGTLLYFLLTGRPPFVGDSLVDTLTQVRDRDPVRPRKYDLSVNEDLEMICRKAMDKDPVRRYASAAALAADLGAFLHGEPMIARPLPWWEQQRRWINRNPIAAFTAIIFLCSGLIWLVTSVNYSSRERVLHARLNELVEDVESSKTEADQQESAARLIRNQAEQTRQEQRQILYAAHLRQAGIARQLGDERQVYDSLSREIPNEDRADLRGIEWFYLWSRNQVNSETVPLNFAEPNIVRFSNDGRWLAVADKSGQIEVFDAVTRQPHAAWETPHSLLESMSFSPSSNLLMTSGRDRVIRLWQIDGTRVEAKIELPTEASWKSEFISEAKILVSDNVDQLFVIDIQDPAARTPVSSDFKQQLAIATCPQQGLIAVLGRLGVQVWNVDSNTQRCLIGIEQSSASSENVVRFSQNGDRIAVVYGLGNVLVYELGDYESFQLIASHTVLDEVLDIGFYPDGNRLAVATTTGGIYVWPVLKNPSDEPLAPGETIQWQAHQGRTRSLAISNSGQEIVSVGSDGQFFCWSPKPSPKVALLSPLEFPNGGAGELAFSNPTGQLAAGDENGIQFWDLNSMTLLEKLGVDGNRREGLRLSPDGKFLATSTIDNEQIELWNLPPGPTPRWQLDPIKGEPLTFSPDSKLLVFADRDHDQVVVADSITGRELTNLPASGCLAAAYSPDGLQLALAIDDKVEIWNGQTGQRVRQLRGHRDTVTAVIYSPDGTWLASSGKDRAIRLWNAASGLEQHRLIGHLDDIEGLAFSRDGCSLVSSSGDGTIKVWHVATGELLTDLWNNAKHPAYDLKFSPAGDRLAARLKHGQIVLFNFPGID